MLHNIDLKRIGIISLCMLLCFFLQSCASNNATRAYKVIGAELNKSYKLSNTNLIINYDLGRIDKTNCVYSSDLGFIINDKNYTNKYIKQFKSNYKSPNTLRKEAKRKVVEICNLLLRLHKKYPILSTSQYHYVKNLSRTSLTQPSSKNELEKLDKILAFIPVLLPLYTPIISSHYGSRFHPIKKQQKFHCGIDLIAKPKAQIYAAANGKVVFVGRKNKYGNVVEIQHSPNLKTVYAHLSAITVKNNQSVIRGQAIGKQGNTGASTAEHLHFEIRIKNNHVNPSDFIGTECSCRKK